MISAGGELGALAEKDPVNQQQNHGADDGENESAVAARGEADLPDRAALPPAAAAPPKAPLPNVEVPPVAAERNGAPQRPSRRVRAQSGN